MGRGFLRFGQCVKKWTPDGGVRLRGGDAPVGGEMRLSAGIAHHAEKEKSLSFEMESVCPAGTVACSLPVILAAYAAGGKAGPVMGLRPLLGPPCIPPEAPPSGFQFP